MEFIHHWNLRLTSAGADPGLQERGSGTTATAPAGAQPLSGPASGGSVAAAHGEHLLHTCFFKFFDVAKILASNPAWFLCQQPAEPY